MENNYIIIVINGVEYYIQADRIGDLAFINNKLVNVSNSNITMVNSFDYQTTFPRITCGAMAQCILRQNNQNYTLVNSNYTKQSNFNMNELGLIGQNNVLIFLLSLILGFKLIL